MEVLSFPGLTQFSLQYVQQSFHIWWTILLNLQSVIQRSIAMDNLDRSSEVYRISKKISPISFGHQYFVTWELL